MSFQALRRHAASLPGAKLDIKWGEDEAYCVGEKMFALFRVEGGRLTGVMFKVDAERFLELTDREGVIPAPYLARAHWVQLRDPKALPLDEAKRLIARAHALVVGKLTRKVREAALGAPGGRQR